MRKNLFLLTIALALLSLASCKKVWDYVKDHPNGYADNCKVDKIYFTEYFLDPISTSDYIPFKDTANFTYNAKGQLISIDYASDAHHLNIDPNPIIGFAFAYDSQGRLLGFFERGKISYNGYYVGAFAHKYTYVNNNLIIDSTFKNYITASQSGDNLEISYGDINGVDSIFLDSWGRIVRHGSTTYNYDASGNRIIPGVRYTSKKSMLQTDKTLMFITRDYSINTPAGIATQFNSNQLPVKFNPGEPALFVTTIYSNQHSFEKQIAKVAYQCK
ncbi:hypothetical protein [Agriterribacter sp.]|uniref:hypothetical protein n=1 Tax=Agriterribacter sp. TaxID=2821509 RepID=UPI002C6B4AFE|nr:hypothetical protein [Agriterribacter sp.]HRP57482.1 hypothetical protein [Agriterribacter sp.]